jgi:hypothetical protein
MINDECIMINHITHYSLYISENPVNCVENNLFLEKEIEMKN